MYPIMPKYVNDIVLAAWIFRKNSRNFFGNITILNYARQ